MDSEAKVLAAVIGSRAAYDNVLPFNDVGDFTDMGELVFKEVGKYYSKDNNAECADADALLNRLCRAHPKHTAVFEKFFSSLKPVSVDNVLEDYYTVKKDSCAELAGSFLLAGEHAKAAPLLDRYRSLEAHGLQADDKDAPKVFQDADADDFLDSLSTENRIPLHPPELNEHIGGGLIRGCHVVVYAPPECGKTATAINFAYGIANSGRKVMYFGNEESAPMYLNRMLCRFCRWPIARVQADREGAMSLARTRGWSNLVFVHLSPGSVPQIQALLREHKPDVAIIDQLSNVMLGSGKEPEKAILLEKLAYQMRMFYAANEIAGISFSQADEKAIGKLFLTIKDIFYSNIAVQGQADLMIGIGMNGEYERMGRRMLCLTKNKLGGVHLNVPVQLIHQVSMLKGVR